MLSLCSWSTMLPVCADWTWGINASHASSAGQSKDPVGPQCISCAGQLACRRAVTNLKRACYIWRVSSYSYVCAKCFSLALSAHG